MKKLTVLTLAIIMLITIFPLVICASTAEGENKLEGKTIACIGDSITAAVGVTKDENDYVTLLAEQLGMDYLRLGVSGTTLCTGGHRTCNIGKLTESNLAGADVVTILMGINDFDQAKAGYYSLGDISSTDTSTVYGAMRMWCERIVELKRTESLANTEFYFVTPMITSWNHSVSSSRDWDQSKTTVHGHTLRDMCNAIIEVSALYGIKSIDLNLISGIYYNSAEDNNISLFGGDGVHPGAVGHSMMAKAIANVLLEKDQANDHEHTFGSWVTTTYPSCAKGEEKRVCTVCSATESRELDATEEHSYTSTVTPPTCAEQGYTTYICSCGESYVDNYVPATGHSYENGICTVCSAKASPYFQQLPDNITGCSNLYSILTPEKGYYTATKYDTSNGAVLSVVIPVEPGDRIAASSFGPVSENMGSVDGIRVTYLLDGTIVESLSPSSVYTAYTKDGYLIVPAGVNMVSIPWWTPSDSNWVTLSQISKNFASHRPKTVSAQAPTCTEYGYTAGEICEVCNVSLGSREEIPATGHDYSGNTCTVCGNVNVLAILDGKYVSILGDSISTFNGYSNDATVNTTLGGNGHRYDLGIADSKPGSYCLLKSVDDTWWMHFANRSGMKLLVNNSWAGSQVFGCKTSDGRVIPAAYLERCINLHDNTIENNPNNAPINPDVIFVYIGINDYNFNRSNVGNGAVDYAALINSDGNYITPDTFGEAYGILLNKMQQAYPNAQIFAMTLLPENLFSVDKIAWEQHNAYIRAAAEYYDIPVVDLAEKCAITWSNYSGYMMDKIHPTTAGMKLISDCIEEELASYYTANPPHTHSYTPTVTPPTCTEQGYTTYTCECGDSYVSDYVDAAGHNLGDWFVVTEATCTDDGEKQRKCNKCGYYEAEGVNANGHNYSAVTTNPTCTEQGYTTYTCKCGDVYVSDYVDSLGHAYGEWQLDDEYHWRACSTCGAPESEKAEHVDQDENELCDLCSKEMPKAETPEPDPKPEPEPEPPTPDYPTVEPEAPTPTPDGKENVKQSFIAMFLELLIELLKDIARAFVGIFK